jgi:hypothetical protein
MLRIPRVEIHKSIEVAASADEVGELITDCGRVSLVICGKQRSGSRQRRAEGRWSGSPRDLQPDTGARWLQPWARVCACEPLAEGLRSAWAVRRRDQRSRRHRLAGGTRKGEWLDTRLAAACRQQLADHVR